MKKSLIAIGLVAASSPVWGADAYVVDVYPQTQEQARYESVPTQQLVCGYEAQRNGTGYIERGVNGIFGSTEGLLGTAVGVAIGDKIGGGSGNEAAKVIGGVLGNKVGNNISRNRDENCREVTRMVQQRYTETVVTGYNVLVELDGEQYWVKRNYEPQVDSYIPVRVTVR